MANVSKTLPAPTEKQSPYVRISIPEADQLLNIIGGWIQDVPQVWKLVGAYLSATTTADVANRYMYLYNRSELSASTIVSLKGGVIAASQTKTWQLGPVIHETSSGILSDALTGFNADSLVIGGNGLLVVYIGNGQVGDVWSGDFVFKYLNRELGMPYLTTKGLYSPLSGVL